MLDHILYSSAALVALTNPLAELPIFLRATEGASTANSRRAIRIFERFSGLILIAVGFQMGLGGIQEFFLGGAPGALSPP